MTTETTKPRTLERCDHVELKSSWSTGRRCLRIKGHQSAHRLADDDAAAIWEALDSARRERDGFEDVLPEEMLDATEDRIAQGKPRRCIPAERTDDDIVFAALRAHATSLRAEVERTTRELDEARASLARVTEERVQYEKHALRAGVEVDRLTAECARLREEASIWYGPTGPERLDPVEVTRRRKEAAEEMKRLREEGERRYRAALIDARMAAARVLGERAYRAMLAEIEALLRPSPAPSHAAETREWTGDGFARLSGSAAPIPKEDAPTGVTYEEAARRLVADGWRRQPTDDARCRTLCDHGSRCVLPVDHVPADRHETEHGCICCDPRPKEYAPGTCTVCGRGPGVAVTADGLCKYCFTEPATPRQVIDAVAAGTLSPEAGVDALAGGRCEAYEVCPGCDGAGWIEPDPRVPHFPSTRCGRCHGTGRSPSPTGGGK